MGSGKSEFEFRDFPTPWGVDGTKCAIRSQEFSGKEIGRNSEDEKQQRRSKRPNTIARNIALDANYSNVAEALSRFPRLCSCENRS